LFKKLHHLDIKYSDFDDMHGFVLHSHLYMNENDYVVLYIFIHACKLF